MAFSGCLWAAAMYALSTVYNAGPHWEQIRLSANPLILIGADGVSRCPGHCCTVGRLRGGSTAAQQQATCLSHIKLGMRR